MDKVKMFFTYRFKCIGKDGAIRWESESKNLIPDVGRDAIITAAFFGGTQYVNWYIGLFGPPAYTPVAADTLATLLGEAPEITEYSASTRVQLVPDTLSDGVFSNAGTPALFTMTADVDVYGGFVTPGSVKGSTSSLLLSVVKNPTVKTVASGEKLEVVAGLSFINV